MYFEGNTDAVIFNQWIEEFLIPELKAHQTVILDNARFPQIIKNDRVNKEPVANLTSKKIPKKLSRKLLKVLS